MWESLGGTSHNSVQKDHLGALILGKNLMSILVRISNSMFEKSMDKYLNISNWPEIPKHSEKTQQNSNYQRIFFLSVG